MMGHVFMLPLQMLLFSCVMCDAALDRKAWVAASSEARLLITMDVLGEKMPERRGGGREAGDRAVGTALATAVSCKKRDCCEGQLDQEICDGEQGLPTGK